jgi:signal peptidase I
VQVRTFSFLRELASSDGVMLRVIGGCMEPLIGGGEDVLVRRRRLYLPGDIIVFRTDAGSLAAHRVLGYRPGGGRGALVTKGDHCERHDGPVRADAIVGAIQGVRIPLRARLMALAHFARIAVGILSA